MISKFRVGAYLYFFIVVALLFAPMVSRAQSPYGYPFSISGNTITYLSDGLTFANVGASTVSNVAGGPLTVSRPVSVALSGNRPLSVVVTAVPTSVAVAGALGRFAKKVLPGIGTGFALYDLGKDLGFIFGNNADGTLTVSSNVVDPALCYQAPCYKWPLQMGGYTESKQAAATSWCNYAYTSVTSCTFQVQSTPSQIIFKAFNASSCPSGCPSSYRQGITGGAVVSPTSTPSTIQAFEDAVAAKTGWPLGSNIGRALKDAVASGETVALPAPSSVTGPSSVAGPSSITTNPDGSHVTNNTTTNITYGPSSVTINDTTISSSTGPTGSPTGTTTTTGTAPLPTPGLCDLYPSISACQPLGTATALPFLVPPKSSDLYSPAYPTGPGGVWNSKLSQIKATPLFNVAANLMPSVAASGTCPTFVIPLNVGIGNFGSHDFAPPCWIWDFGKFVIVVSALFLARSLVFGG